MTKLTLRNKAEHMTRKHSFMKAFHFTKTKLEKTTKPYIRTGPIFEHALDSFVFLTDLPGIESRTKKFLSIKLQVYF